MLVNQVNKEHPVKKVNMEPQEPLDQRDQPENQASRLLLY